MIDSLKLEKGKSLLSDWRLRNEEELELKGTKIAEFGEYFSPNNLKRITQAGFREFLMFKNNRHWGHIQRHPEIFSEIKRLRRCLAILLDEGEPIDRRLDKILPEDSRPFIKGLGLTV